MSHFQEGDSTYRQRIGVNVDANTAATFYERPVDSRAAEMEETIQNAAERVQAVHSFYVDNKGTIDNAARAFGSLVASGDLAGKTTDAVLDVTKRVVTALDCIEKVHPFVSVAVVAFKVIIDFEVKRRENDKRVSALIVQGTDMMVELFELNEIPPDPETVLSDGRRMMGRLQGVLKEVADAIARCGNTLNRYKSTRTVVKLFKSSEWEDTFVEHASNLEKLKQDLRDAITLRSVRTIVDVSRKLDVIMEMMAWKSKQDETVAVEIMSRGGPVACAQDSAYVRGLMAQTGDTNPSAAVLAQVLRELRTPLERLLDDNRKAYTLLLETKKNEIKDAIQGAEDRLKDALEMRAYMRVKDLHLRHVWHSAHWSTSVETPKFIATLFDYFAEHYARTRSDRVRLTAAEPALSTTVEQAQPVDSSGMQKDDVPPGPPLAAEDEWCLAYLDVFSVQALKETFDEDANGMVNVREVNEFTSPTVLPPHWSLLRRLVYAAAGWQVESIIYQIRIQALFNSMIAMQSEVLPANRTIVRIYLESPLIRLIQLFARGVAEVTRDVTDETALESVALERMALHEAHLQQLLEQTNFEIPSLDSAAIYFGKGRFELYFLPIIFVLMRRHAEIIKFCEREILDARELAMASEALESIIDRAMSRIAHLEESFLLQGADPDTRFTSFARGLYSLVWDPSKSPDELEFLDDHPEDCGDVGVELEDINPSVNLRYGILNPVISDSVDMDPMTRQAMMAEYAELAARTALGFLFQDGVSHSLTRDQYERRARLIRDLDAADVQYLDAKADLNLRLSGLLCEVRCDGCRAYPVHATFHRCLDCSFEDDTYDLCGDCVHVPTEEHTSPAMPKVHTIYHNMVRFTYAIPVIAQRRLLRETFILLRIYAAERSPRCCECETDISYGAPVYCCVTCPELRRALCFFCLDCATLPEFLNAQGHEGDGHWLVLLRDRQAGSATGERIPPPRTAPDPYAPKPRPVKVEDLDKRLSSLGDRVSTLDTRVAGIENSVGQILEKLDLLTRYASGDRERELPANEAHWLAQSDPEYYDPQGSD